MNPLIPVWPRYSGGRVVYWRGLTITVQGLNAIRRLSLPERAELAAQLHKALT